MDSIKDAPNIWLSQISNYSGKKTIFNLDYDYMHISLSVVLYWLGGGTLNYKPKLMLMKHFTIFSYKVMCIIGWRAYIKL